MLVCAMLSGSRFNASLISTRRVTGSTTVAVYRWSVGVKMPTPSRN